MARLISLGIIVLLIAILGLTFYRIFAPFLVPLFLAALTAFLGQPIFRYCLARCRNRRSWAALLSTTAIIAAVMLPLVVSIVLGVLQLVVITFQSRDAFVTAIEKARFTETGQMIEDSGDDLGAHAARPIWQQKFVGQGVTLLDRVCGPELSWIEIDVLHSVTADDVEAIKADASLLRVSRETWVGEQMQRMRGVLQQVVLQSVRVLASSLGYAANLVAALAALLIALIVYTIALYYFFLDGVDLLTATETLIPMDRVRQRELIANFASSIRAVVMATFLAAVGQGLATAIGIKLVGMGPFFLLLIASTLSALIPMAGTWLVWFPCACVLAWQGHWGAAIFLSVYGIGFVGMLDNVIRTYVLKNETKLHPLLAVVSVFGGLQVMGLWGVFMGPVVACCLHSLLEIFNQEVRAMTQEPAP